MSRTKEIMTAAGTLACALGIGFVMQSSETADQWYGPMNEDPIVPTAASDDPVEAADDLLVMDVQEITLTSALPQADIKLTAEDAPLPMAVKQAGLLPFPQPQTDKPEISVTSCNVDFVAEATENAFVNISLGAPCLANERVAIHHNGMVFTVATDEAGAFDLAVPALTEKAHFSAAVSGEQVAAATTTVSDLDAYNRVVLQWEGQSGFELHARESGAEYGAKGHIWRASGVSMGNLTSGSGGYLVALGDRSVTEPFLAEVYTFPVGAIQVDLSVEAQVTLSNCGLDIEAETFELRAGSSLRSHDVSFSVPGCDAVGDYLVLNNVFEDLKLAAR